MTVATLEARTPLPSPFTGEGARLGSLLPSRSGRGLMRYAVPLSRSCQAASCQANSVLPRKGGGELA